MAVSYTHLDVYKRQALKIASDEVPEPLKDKRIVSLDLTGMIAGTKYRGDFEDRIKNAMDEVKACLLYTSRLMTIIIG